MSTNPYCIGIPGGARGPVILDFATSAAAGGRVCGAKLAGAIFPDGILIDRDGNPTRNPQDYFDGGTILPAGGAKGYALAVAAEIITEAMLGPVSVECNWLMIAASIERRTQCRKLPKRFSQNCEIAHPLPAFNVLKFQESASEIAAPQMRIKPCFCLPQRGQKSRF